MSEEATGNGHQQERGSEMKDFLFLFKVLSFEQRVQGVRTDKSFVYPSVVIWAGHGRFGMVACLHKATGIYGAVIMSYSFTLFDTFLRKHFPFSQGESLR